MLKLVKWLAGDSIINRYIKETRYSYSLQLCRVSETPRRDEQGSVKQIINRYDIEGT